MKAENVVRYVLANNAGVSSLVSSRIYPAVLPQKPSYPAVVFKTAGSRRIEGVHTDPGVAVVNVQVIAWASNYDDAKELAEAIRVALERHGSAVTGTPINGVTVYDIKIGSQADAYEPEIDAFAVSTDFTVTHAE